MVVSMDSRNGSLNTITTQKLQAGISTPMIPNAAKYIEEPVIHNEDVEQMSTQSA